MSFRGWWCAVLLAACAPAERGADRASPAPPTASAANGGGASAQLSSADDNAPALVPVNAASTLFPACVTTGTITTSLRPTNFLFLIDRSGSLNCNLPPLTSSEACERTPEKAVASEPSKWEIVRVALEAAIAALPANARAGITYFSNDDMCGVQSRPSVAIAALEPQQRAALTQSLDGVTPRGGTPIVGGLILAYKHLNPDQTSDVPNGNRYVVLLTDGQEGCAADQAARLLDTELPKSRSAGISTFVIGVPGSEVNRGFLSRLAFAGGAPSSPQCDHSGTDPSQGDCHFDMTRDPDLASGLSRVLAAIGGEALRCEFDVPRPANGQELDYDTVNIVYSDCSGGDEHVVAQDASAACEQANGWQYNADRTKIVLCGQACNVARGAASIRIALGCKTAVLL